MSPLLRSGFAKFQEVFAIKLRTLGIVAFGAIFLIFLSMAHRNVAPGTVVRKAPQVPSTGFLPEAQNLAMSARVPGPTGGYSLAPSDSGMLHSTPVMVQAAELTMSTQDFPKSRSRLEEILDRQSGYIAKLRMESQPSGSVLSATLRIPSSNLERALIDLKTLGHVEREEQSADEVTQQRADIQGRLLNAQNTIRRLEEVIKNPSSKFMDEVELQRQLVRARAEIQRLETEQHGLETRVAFSNVLLSLNEEHAAVAETLGAQLRNAAVGGFSDAAHTLSSMLVFLAEYAPSLMLWGLILLLPARLLWKRRKQWIAEANAQSQGV